MNADEFDSRPQAGAELLTAVYEALEAFALDKWGCTNPILVPEHDRDLQKAYYRACPFSPRTMIDGVRK